jgi:hypothetical protein
VDKSEEEMSPHDYDTKKFVVDNNALRPEDKINWHRKTWDLVGKDLIQATLNARKLRLQITKL